MGLRATCQQRTRYRQQWKPVDQAAHRFLAAIAMPERGRRWEMKGLPSAMLPVSASRLPGGKVRQLFILLIRGAFEQVSEPSAVFTDLYAVVGSPTEQRPNARARPAPVDISICWSTWSYRNAVPNWPCRNPLNTFVGPAVVLEFFHGGGSAFCISEIKADRARPYSRRRATQVLGSRPRTALARIE